MLAHEVAVALDAAERAAATVMSVYATDFTVDFKGRDDPVTRADREANESIVRALRTAFPDDGVCSEEGDVAAGLLAATTKARCWFVDPLDGTREFVARNGEFCVMVGLAIDGVARLGVVVAPAWKRTFWGVVDEGAWERGERGETRLVARDGEIDAVRMVVSRSHLDPRVPRVAERIGARELRPCGSVGLKALLVATGDVDLYVHAGRGPKLWDGCAPEAIARAAGATVTNGAGEPLRYDTTHLALDRGLIFARGAVHARAVAAFGAAGP